MYHTTGLRRDELTELCALVAECSDFSVGRCPPVLGRYNSVVVTVAYLRRNRVQAAMDSLLADAARGLVAAGAQGLVLCTNTMHRCAPAITAAAPGVPFLHIEDVLADALTAAEVHRAGLLGTRFTMEGPLYPQMLGDRGIEVVTPDAAGRGDVHRIIYDELTRGVVEPASRQRYREVIAGLVARGADAVVLGCTEIALLVQPDDDAAVPVFDTTALHARAAADWVLGG